MYRGIVSTAVPLRPDFLPLQWLTNGVSVNYRGIYKCYLQYLIISEGKTWNGKRIDRWLGISDRNSEVRMVVHAYTNLEFYN
jgi:hypothetical protein